MPLFSCIWVAGHIKVAKPELDMHYPRSQAVGETAWQLLRVQTVYGCYVTVIAIFHYNRLVHVILTIFYQLRDWAFLLVEATLCCPFYYWSEIEVVRTKIVMQSAYTSAIERSLLKRNGCDCDGSIHYVIGFYCCHVTTFWNLIGTTNFQVVEETVWTRGSCQAISPTAWEWG